MTTLQHNTQLALRTFVALARRQHLSIIDAIRVLIGAWRELCAQCAEPYDLHDSDGFSICTRCSSEDEIREFYEDMSE